WTCYLRTQARWSTGEPVTAGDFVRSWQRTLRLADLAPHTDLLSNIVGARAYMGAVKAGAQPATGPSQAANRNNEGTRSETPRRSDTRLVGAEEIDTHVLRVHLQRPNTNFPALVAHPVFRP